MKDKKEEQGEEKKMEGKMNETEGNRGGDRGKDEEKPITPLAVNASLLVAILFQPSWGYMTP